METDILLAFLPPIEFSSFPHLFQSVTKKVKLSSSRDDFGKNKFHVHIVKHHPGNVLVNHGRSYLDSTFTQAAKSGLRVFTR